MAEVQFIGTGTPVEAGDGDVQIIRNPLIPAGGQTVGVVATVAPAGPGPVLDTAIVSTVAVSGQFIAPQSIAPQESPVLAGPTSSVAPFTTGSLRFMPGTVAQLLDLIGNSAENAYLPGTDPNVLTPTITQPRDQTTLRRGERVVFLDAPGVQSQLRGLSVDITDYTQATDLGGGVVRDVLTLGSALPVANGPADVFVIVGRKLIRNTPVAEIILG